jgi:hypothetical protein
MTVSSDENTARLLARACAGDREAWADLIGPCLRPLNQYAATLLPATVRAAIGPGISSQAVRVAVRRALLRVERMLR